MEECSSVRSTDSAGTSEEYEIVESEPATVSTPRQDHPLEPTLNIANNGNMEDLRLELTEVCDPLCPLVSFFLFCYFINEPCDGGCKNTSTVFLAARKSQPKGTD